MNTLLRIGPLSASLGIEGFKKHRINGALGEDPLIPLKERIRSFVIPTVDWNLGERE